MTGLMYPKPVRKKKRKKHGKSILHERNGTCYLCMELLGNYTVYPVVHEHHIYDGPNKPLSEEDGLKVYLCVNHHIMHKEAVHENIDHMRFLQREGQRAFERTHTREEFYARYKRYYLEEEK